MLTISTDFFRISESSTVGCLANSKHRVGPSFPSFFLKVDKSIPVENEEGAVISDAARKIIPVHWGSFAFFSKKHGQKGGISNEFALEIYINYINQRMKRCFSLLL